MSRTDKDIPGWVTHTDVVHTWMCAAGLRPCSAGATPRTWGCTTWRRPAYGPPRRYRHGALHGRDDRTRVRDQLRAVLAELRGSGDSDIEVEPGRVRIDDCWSWLD